MIGYAFLSIAVFTGVAKGFCGKKTSEYIYDVKNGLILQSIRLILCVIIGACLFAFSGTASKLDNTILLISFINGFANAAFLISWLFAIKSGAYLFVDICLTAGGILIPCICGEFFFDGNITLLQYIGIAIMLIAVIVMNSYNFTITKKKISLKNMLLLLCVAISNGVMGLCEKWFTSYIKTEKITCDLSVFSLYTYIFACLALLIALYLVCKKENTSVNTCINEFPFKKLWIYLVLIALFLFFNTYFTTITNTYINNTVLIYPLKFGSNLILSAIMAATLLKEKINLQSVIGMILITTSIIFINVL